MVDSMVNLLMSVRGRCPGAATVKSGFGRVNGGIRFRKKNSNWTVGRARGHRREQSQELEAMREHGPAASASCRRAIAVHLVVGDTGAASADARVAHRQPAVTRI